MRSLNLEECETILVTVYTYIHRVVDISQSASFSRNNKGRTVPFHSVGRERDGFGEKRVTIYFDKLAPYFQQRRGSVGSTALDHSRVINYRPATHYHLGDRVPIVWHAWQTAERQTRGRGANDPFIIRHRRSLVSPPCLPPVVVLRHSFVIVARTNLGHGLLLSRHVTNRFFPPIDTGEISKFLRQKQVPN